MKNTCTSQCWPLRSDANAVALLAERVENLSPLSKRSCLGEQNELNLAL